MTTQGIKTKWVRLPRKPKRIPDANWHLMTNGRDWWIQQPR